MITEAGMKHTEEFSVTRYVIHVPLIYLETNRSEQRDFNFLTFDKTFDKDAELLLLSLLHVGQRKLKSAHVDL